MSMRVKYFSVAVHDLDAAVVNYQARFGMQALDEKKENSIGRFHFVPMGYDGTAVLHLISPFTEESPVHRLMKDRTNPLNPHGEGLYQLMMECDDPDAMAKQVEAGGGRITRLGEGGPAWVHPLSSNFVLMELTRAD
ncbi:MAG: hypothetical protein EXR63_05050 [Dehalococcoidia bacterium]|nr:hypothetical protein [Dehalococcoidia bacterium]